VVLRVNTKIGYAVELKKVSGKASLAGELTANDPYAEMGQQETPRGPDEGIRPA
jgi:hypothetical protein